MLASAHAWGLRGAGGGQLAGIHSLAVLVKQASGLLGVHGGGIRQPLRRAEIQRPRIGRPGIVSMARARERPRMHQPAVRGDLGQCR